MVFPVPLSSDLIQKALELGVRTEDVEERFIRGGGHGGQKINKTSSMVQLIHRPTGIEVRMQKHREQSKNRLSAWKLLILKIEQRKLGEKSALQKKIFKLKKQKARRSRKARRRSCGSRRSSAR